MVVDFGSGEASPSFMRFAPVGAHVQILSFILRYYKLTMVRYIRTKIIVRPSFPFLYAIYLFY